ncbi:MAG: YdcF family protein [Pseudomonadota bacterium]
MHAPFPLFDGASLFDVAIVLGASARPDGTPSPAMARRVAHAVELARAGRAAHLLMSGGPVRHPLPEAWMMRDMALAAGLAPERVHVEDRSRNTIENARLSAPIVAARGWSRAVVVTDAFHAFRTSYVFRRLGLEVAVSPVFPPDRRRKEWWLSYLREASAFPWTVLRVERSILLER